MAPAGAAVILAAVAAITTAPASHAPAEPEGPPGFVEVAPALEAHPCPGNPGSGHSRSGGPRERAVVRRSVRLVQWFNHACSWHQPKHSLAKWAARRSTGRAGRASAGASRALSDAGSSSTIDRRWNILESADVKLLDVYRRILRPGDAVIDAGG